MPLRKEYDKNVTAYAIGQSSESKVVLLLSSARPLDLQDLNTVYVGLKKRPGLKFCIANLTQVNRIMLLPSNSDPNIEPECVGLSEDQLSKMAFDFFQDTNSGRGPLCPHS
jgi:hypothetical protein